MSTKKIQIINGASIIPQSDWNQTDETKSDYIKNKPEISDEDAVKMVRTSAADNENVVGKRIFMLDESNKDTLHATLKTMYSQTDQCLVFIKMGNYYYHAQCRKSGKYLYLQYNYCDSSGLFKTRFYEWNSEGTAEDGLTITDKSNYAGSKQWYDDEYYFTTPPTVQAVDEKLTEKLDDKQDKKISDAGGYFTAKTVDGALQEIGAKKEEWDGKYSKPTGGIPKTDLASAVKTSLDKADTAYQKPTNGISKSDLAEGVIPTRLSQLGDDATHRTVTDEEKTAWNGKGTYSKPTDGIPKTDLASAVQMSLGKADTALQSVPSTYAKKTDIPTIPTKISSFTNDSGYLTLSTLPVYDGGVS